MVIQRRSFKDGCSKQVIQNWLFKDCFYAEQTVDDAYGGLKMDKKMMKPGFSVRLAIMTSVLLLAANLLLGFNLMKNSRIAMKTLIDNRMLDISKSAADMLDGDVLESLTAEDEDTEGYRKVSDTLAVFQDNIDLKYIYCVTACDDGSFVFSVDPTEEDPGEFGSPVVSTPALVEASHGISAVDAEPYSDAWGRFYSSYSPVFDSNGNVAGIVAVDFSADWYDEHIAGQNRAIMFNCFLSVLVGVLLIMLATGQLRIMLSNMISEIGEVAKDLDDLTHEINPNSPHVRVDDTSRDDIQTLARNIHLIKENLHKYVEDMNMLANKMVTALSSGYRSVYYVDLDMDEGVCYQEHSHMENGLQQGEYFKYEETLKKYADDYVTEEYRESFLQFISPDAVRAGLKNEDLITLRYMVDHGGSQSYEMLAMAGVRRPEDRDDNIVHAVGMAFADVDMETRKNLDRSQALKDALAAAEGANKAKTAFLSNMSHEIRTPMNAIIGLNRITLEDPALPPTARENLEKIGASAEHLLGIINDILDMSRIEAGKMSLVKEDFSLKKLLEQIDVMIGGQCRDKGLNWHWELVGDTAHTYSGDSVKLRQVLINILGNSVKFTPAGGNVTLLAERLSGYEDKSTFCFTISDTGIGMDKEYLPRLFEPFSQEDATTKTKYGSTGLGMSITKNIVEMMNGDISVESEKNVGTTFRIKLTLDDSKQKNDAETVSVEGSASDKAVAQISDEEIKNILTGRRILVAEDMEINAQIIKKLLQMKNMECEHAPNGRIAVDMYEEHPVGYYDAILMDMRMPEMDGLEATRVIRTSDRSDAKNIPIIALTANAFDEDVQHSLQAGVDAHLSKPVDQDSIFKMLASLIRNH